MAQWLGLSTFTAEGQGSILNQETRIPQAVEKWSKKKKKKKTCEDLFINSLKIALIKVDTVIAIMRIHALKIYILKILFVYLFGCTRSQL